MADGGHTVHTTSDPFVDAIVTVTGTAPYDVDEPKTSTNAAASESSAPSEEQEHVLCGRARRHSLGGVCWSVVMACINPHRLGLPGALKSALAVKVYGSPVGNEHVLVKAIVTRH